MLKIPPANFLDLLILTIVDDFPQPLHQLVRIGHQTDLTHLLHSHKKGLQGLSGEQDSLIGTAWSEFFTEEVE